MKSLIILLSLTLYSTSLLAAAKNKNLLSCKQISNDYAKVFLKFRNDPFKLTLVEGLIRYNYSTAAIVCPNRSINALKEKKPFICAGVWSFDLRKPGSTEGTPTVAKFTPKQDGNWVVTFKTSHDYGRNIIKVGCGK